MCKSFQPGAFSVIVKMSFPAVVVRCTRQIVQNIGWAAVAVMGRLVPGCGECNDSSNTPTLHHHLHFQQRGLSQHSRFESFSLFTRNIEISLFVCQDKTMDVLTPRKWSSNGHQYLKLVVVVGNSLNSHFHPSQSGPAQLGSDVNTDLDPGLAWCCVPVSQWPYFVT